MCTISLLPILLALSCLDVLNCSLVDEIPRSYDHAFQVEDSANLPSKPDKPLASSRLPCIWASEAFLTQRGSQAPGMQKDLKPTRVPTKLGDSHTCDPVQRRLAISSALLASAAHCRGGIHLQMSFDVPMLSNCRPRPGPQISTSAERLFRRIGPACPYPQRSRGEPQRLRDPATPSEAPKVKPKKSKVKEGSSKTYRPNLEPRPKHH